MSSLMAKVLVIEDNQDLREFMKAALKIGGHDVIEAVDGREGLERLSTQELPELMIVDWLMPVMGGEEFLREREKDPRLTRIPALVLSGTDKLEVQATNVEFVQKPVDLDLLLGLVSKSVRE